jgi:beta-lactamase superfamily II metal-dependent hydrolase
MKAASPSHETRATQSIGANSRRFACLFALVLATSSCVSPRQSLDIYFVDVEGGQATLIVEPGGESLLIDAGHAGQGKAGSVPGDPLLARDAQRILAAARAANVTKIDILIVTHFHADHFGGVMELAQLLPIDTILDPGTEVQETAGNSKTRTLIDAYKSVRSRSNYRQAAAGEEFSLGELEITVVSAAGDTIETPLADAGSVTPGCDRETISASEPIENPRSIGVLLRFGDFRFLNLGDLTGQPLSDLVCPDNLIGPVSAYLVPHHGAEDAADPATFAAFQPRVAILNNSARKGGHPAVFRLLRSVEGLEDTWQLDIARLAGTANFPSEQIANLDTRSSHWLRLSGRRDGSFSVFNSRTGLEKDY